MSYSSSVGQPQSNRLTVVYQNNAVKTRGVSCTGAVESRESAIITQQEGRDCQRLGDNFPPPLGERRATWTTLHVDMTWGKFGKWSVAWWLFKGEATPLKQGRLTHWGFQMDY